MPKLVTYHTHLTYIFLHHSVDQDVSIINIIQATLEIFDDDNDDDDD